MAVELIQIAWQALGQQPDFFHEERHQYQRQAQHHQQQHADHQYRAEGAAQAMALHGGH